MYMVYVCETDWIEKERAKERYRTAWRKARGFAENEEGTSQSGNKSTRGTKKVEFEWKQWLSVSQKCGM